MGFSTPENEVVQNQSALAEIQSSVDQHNCNLRSLVASLADMKERVFGPRVMSDVGVEPRPCPEGVIGQINEALSDSSRLAGYLDRLVTDLERLA